MRSLVAFSVFALLALSVFAEDASICCERPTCPGPCAKQITVDTGMIPARIDFSGTSCCGQPACPQPCGGTTARVVTEAVEVKRSCCGQPMCTDACGNPVSVATNVVTTNPPHIVTNCCGQPLCTDPCGRRRVQQVQVASACCGRPACPRPCGPVGKLRNPFGKNLTKADIRKGGSRLGGKKGGNKNKARKAGPARWKNAVNRALRKGSNRDRKRVMKALKKSNKALNKALKTKPSKKKSNKKAKKPSKKGKKVDTSVFDAEFDRLFVKAIKELRQTLFRLTKTAKKLSAVRAKKRNALTKQSRKVKGQIKRLNTIRRKLNGKEGKVLKKFLGKSKKGLKKGKKLLNALLGGGRKKAKKSAKALSKLVKKGINKKSKKTKTSKKAKKGPKGLCKKGRRQSPIDIKTRAARPLVGALAQTKKISSSYKPSKVSLINSGRHVGASGKFGFLKIGRDTYEAVELAFYAPSMHKKDGKSSPLEVVVWHRKKSGKGMAAVSVLFDVAPAKNSFLNNLRLWTAPSKKGRGKQSLTSVNINDLQLRGAQFYNYQGSRLIAPCQEDTTWLISTKSVTASKDQIQAIKKFFRNGNSRPTKPLNGRKISLIGGAAAPSKKKTAAKKRRFALLDVLEKLDTESA